MGDLCFNATCIALKRQITYLRVSLELHQPSETERSTRYLPMSTCADIKPLVTGLSQMIVRRLLTNQSLPSMTSSLRQFSPIICKVL